ncbi:GntR family transcriptional regulator [Leifsonia aquatica]|uniref:GntR family transcriptional regulator n=1 Tax=Leifsonia aquatica TaxID=144185 RepID=UPI0037FC5522
MAGDLHPGEKLLDAEIEQWVGASRTPIREAMQQLATMGLIEILPQKLTRVTPIEPTRLAGAIALGGELLRCTVRDATPLSHTRGQDDAPGAPEKSPTSAGGCGERRRPDDRIHRCVRAPADRRLTLQRQHRAISRTFTASTFGRRRSRVRGQGSSPVLAIRSGIPWLRS